MMWSKIERYFCKKKFFLNNNNSLLTDGGLSPVSHFNPAGSDPNTYFRSLPSAPKNKCLEVFSISQNYF